MEYRLEQISAALAEYAHLAVDYLSRPTVLFQLISIALLFVVAWLVARRIEPKLTEKALKLNGMPGVLRLVVAFAQRLQWLFLFLLLAALFLLTRLLDWPENNYLLANAMILAGAWLAISVISHAIRSRIIGRLFALAAWLYVAATVLGVSAEVVSILDGAGISVGKYRLSMLTLVQALILIAVLLWLATNVGNFLDRRIQKIDELTPSLRVLLGKVLRIVVIALAALVALEALGIDLTALTVLSGAIGLGIGFGLQKVVSNFFSGIIILMDQSIKPGDTITLGETFGWIRELRARFVSVVTRDGREFLIPNEDFITTQVVNWSFSDQYVRLDVPFGVSYASDPHEVSRIAIEAASGVDRVRSVGKAPVCWMTGFGDSSLDFLLRFWIVDPQAGLTNVRGKVLLALWDAFKEHDINIPFPHREVIMQTPVSVVRPQSREE